MPKRSKSGNLFERAIETIDQRPYKLPSLSDDEHKEVNYTLYPPLVWFMPSVLSTVSLLCFRKIHIKPFGKNY